MKYRTKVISSKPFVYAIEQYRDVQLVRTTDNEILTFASWLDAEEWISLNTKKWWDFWK